MSKSFNTKELSANPLNPRKPWKDGQASKFEDSLKIFGDLSGVVFNRRTKQLVGGHKRVEQFQQDTKAEVTIKETLQAKDQVGTKAYGYITLGSGVRFSYREVDWPPSKEKAAMLAANRWSAEWDFAVLNDALFDLSQDKNLGFEFSVTGFEGLLTSPADLNLYPLDPVTGTKGGAYSMKVLSPVYVPTGKCPKISELVSTEKRDALVQKIKAAKIKDSNTEQFLLMAAQRHLVFDYGKIAEFYAHADKKTQRLVEDLTLVIVDFKKAIEDGFVCASEELRQLSAENENLAKPANE